MSSPSPTPTIEHCPLCRTPVDLAAALGRFVAALGALTEKVRDVEWQLGLPVADPLPPDEEFSQWHP